MLATSSGWWTSRRSELYLYSVPAGPFFYKVVASTTLEVLRMKKKHKHEDLYCPECEKVNKKIRLVRDECPECHYQPTRV